MGRCSLTCAPIGAAVALMLFAVGCGGAGDGASCDVSCGVVGTDATARASGTVTSGGAETIGGAEGVVVIEAGEVVGVRAGRRAATRNELVRGEIMPRLREGDVVFRRGGGAVSRAVLAADRGGAYSHVGVVAEVGGALVVVHVVPGEPDARGVRDVTKIDHPEEFFAPRKASRGAVMRLRDVGSNASVGGMRANALTVSDIACRAARSAVRLAAAAIPFDHDYDLADTARMYCTELVWHLFRGEGVDLSGGRRTRVNLPGMSGDYIMPSDISSAPELELIVFF